MSNSSVVPSETILKVKAIKSLLVEKGLISEETTDHIVDYFENKVGPRNGCKVVATAWTDPAFKERLLKDGTAAIKEFGFQGFEGAWLQIVENTDEVHNMVVCTLCSCYPWPVLGLPPMWFKSAEYRAQVVIEPRGVLKQFGIDLPEEKEIRVWDSNAEIRFLVLPQRPANTKGWSLEQLEKVVTRDSMIGTGLL
ncbi:Nitrile hydratase, alpha subunit [Pseudomonas syringae pv. aceris]|uniref:nitrile hydratase n=2 Tax=Pseudomonas syringae TaxID=317 RepID=A0A0L8IPW7_PSESX|nr:nitrile hydratase subunit alpha [Pseudomonas syringae]EGH71495.1 nitrile hydratase, alpha subunit [Pseudomonas syringae pv. aceris str. M302273]KOG03532.1 Nitrile hydratase, alpha subunit [Pseudomonas syringae pv. aceris]KPW19550.1 Nitrile hydratase, alpha subunit [Pseudomonas syringae pv. aceris]